MILPWKHMLHACKHVIEAARPREKEADTLPQTKPRRGTCMALRASSSLGVEGHT